MEIMCTLWKLVVTFMEIICTLWKFVVTYGNFVSQGLVQKGVISWTFGVGRGRSESVAEQERSPVRSARRNRKGLSYGNKVALSWKISIARLVPDRLQKFVALYEKKVSINDSLWKLFILYGNLQYFMENSYHFLGEKKCQPKIVLISHGNPVS